jgi:hypothetical protein
MNSDFIMFIDLDTSQNYEKFLDELKKLNLNFNNNQQNNQFVLVNLAYNQLELSNKYSSLDLQLTQFSLIDYNNLKTLSLLADIFNSNKNVKLSVKNFIYFYISKR